MDINLIEKTMELKQVNEFDSSSRKKTKMEFQVRIWVEALSCRNFQKMMSLIRYNQYKQYAETEMLGIGSKFLQFEWSETSSNKLWAVQANTVADFNTFLLLFRLKGWRKRKREKYKV